MEARRTEAAGEESLQALRRGWCLGRLEYKDQMLAQMEGRLGEHHSGALRLEAAAAKAERMVAEELGRLGWRETELMTRPKSDPNKLAMAARLRRETTLSIKAIARRLWLGTSKSANVRLHEWMTPAIPTAPGKTRKGKKMNHVMG